MPHADGLYYEQHGPADAPPLILSSGLGGSALYWTYNLAALAERHHVITYDHRGTGRSGRDIPGDLTVETMADDVIALMDALGLPRATIIGHALGGHIGLALAFTAPERVDRLVVINGWATLDRHTARCFNTRLALLRDSGARAYLHAQPLFLYPPQWISDHHDRLMAEEEQQFTHFPGPEMIERRIAAVSGFQAGDRLAALDLPSLFIADDHDMLVPPACSERLAAVVPGAQFAWLAGGGHACNVADPDTSNRVILDFLRS